MKELHRKSESEKTGIVDLNRETRMVQTDETSSKLSHGRWVPMDGGHKLRSVLVLKEISLC